MNHLPVSDIPNNFTKEKCFYNPIDKKLSTVNENMNENINENMNENSNKNEIKPLANVCVGCGINMGDNNPRQYCYKTYCPFDNVDESS